MTFTAWWCNNHLENMSSSVGMMTFPTEWNTKIHVPNHQPGYILTIIIISTNDINSPGDNLPDFLQSSKAQPCPTPPRLTLAVDQLDATFHTEQICLTVVILSLSSWRFILLKVSGSMVSKPNIYIYVCDYLSLYTFIVLVMHMYTHIYIYTWCIVMYSNVLYKYQTGAVYVGLLTNRLGKCSKSMFSGDGFS